MKLQRGNNRTDRFDPLSPHERSERMRRIGSSDTKPEMRVRRLTYALGYRYRLHRKDLPGSPDLVFASRRKVIFVHGCFWHLHERCQQYRLPRTRLDFWMPKLRANRDRDQRQQRALRELGWDVLVVWECETRDAEGLASRITSFLEGARAGVT